MDTSVHGESPEASKDASMFLRRNVRLSARVLEPLNDEEAAAKAEGGNGELSRPAHSRGRLGAMIDGYDVFCGAIFEDESRPLKKERAHLMNQDAKKAPFPSGLIGTYVVNVPDSRGLGFRMAPTFCDLMMWSVLAGAHETSPTSRYARYHGVTGVSASSQDEDRC